MTEEFRDEDWSYLINHFVYPVKLIPPNIETNNEQDCLCLDLINLVLKEFQDDDTAKTLKLERIVDLFHEWSQIQTPKLIGEKINWAIKRVISNKCEILPLYLPNQNICLVLSKSPKQDQSPIVLSYFQVSFNNEELMSKSSSDIESIYPTASFPVTDTTILSSLEFANLLADLANDRCEDASNLTKGNSAGNKQQEVREVPDSSLITDWLLHVLIANENYTKEEMKIRKKIRDEVNYYQKLLPFRRSG
jgi:hypothetical protein